MSDQKAEIGKRYITIKKYAELSGVGVHAIYMRIYKSDDGEYSEDHESYLEMTEIEEVEGIFIDINKYPPKKLNRGAKKKQK
jgi:hypothetical protein